MSQHQEWAIKPSQTPFWLDAIVLLIPCYVLWRIWLYPECVQLLWLALVWSSLIVLLRRVRWPDQHLNKLGRDSEGWWMELNGIRQSVIWHDHVIKREQLVVLRWSFWPWHSVTLRRQNFDSANEFRRFRACLYGEW